MSHLHTCTDKWCCASTHCPMIEALKLCHSYAQHQVRNTHAKKISSYWWLFRMQNLSCYITRLAEERRRWTSLIFDRFRFATLKQLLHIAIATADWGRLYKLLYVVLDASISSPAMISPWKRLYIDWSRHLEIGPSLHMGSLRRAHNISQEWTRVISLRLYQYSVLIPNTPTSV